MSKIYSPKIVTDSLVMCLDTSNNKSYPTDLPVKNGLVMWMDAADDSTFSYSSGTTVTQWRDKSGLNNHCTPLTAGPTRSSVLNSRKVLAFTTGQSIGSITFTLETSANTVFVVSRYTSSSTNTGNVLTSYYNGWLLGHWGSQVNKYFAEGWVYIVTVLADTTWRMYMGDWSGSSTDLASFYSNGTELASGITTASAGPKGLGINFQSGDLSTCEAAEIVVFNRVLSIAERRLVNTYLGQKWGISNTDRSIIDLAGNDDNGLLGNGTVANMPLYDYYNKGAFKFFASNKYIKLGISTVVNQFAGDFTVSLWAMATGENSNYGNLIGDYYTASTASLNEWQIMMNNSSAFLNVYRVATAGFASTVINNVSSEFSANTWINVVLSRVGGNITLYANNNIVGTASNSSMFGSTTGSVNIGINGNNSAEPFSGLISNVLIYRKGLSAVEVAQNYKAQKSKFANTIVQQGLVLNLDAGNNYSYAGAGAVWYDVSGNSYNGTLIGSPVYTSNNNGGIIFDSVAKYVTLPASGLAFGTGQFAIEAWVFSTAAVSYNHVYSSQSSNNVGFISLYYQNGYGFSIADLGNSAVRTATTHQTVVSQNTWYHVVGIRNASNQYIVYVNGVESTTNSTSSYPLTATAPQIASNPATTGERFTGTIASFRLYNTSLSAAQVLQNYNATKGRFGL